MPSSIQSIYTDGACSGNPGSGGWGVVVYLTDGSVHELGGRESHTTNNRMEMQAAIAALELLQTYPNEDPIPLYTDSEYLNKGVTSWLRGWKKKNWKTSQGKPVLNQDLWEQLDALNTSLSVSWHHVKAHAGNEGNERCDTIARAFAQGKPIQLRQATPSPSNQTVQSSPAAIASASTPTPADPSTSDHASQPSDATDVESDHSVKSSQDRHDRHPSYRDSAAIMDSSPISSDSLDDLPREMRVGQLRNLIDTLRIADEVARKGYLITSSELADLIDVNASAVTSRGDHWVWRNWVVSRVRREGNQILWLLERVDE